MKKNKIVVFAHGNVNDISCHGGLPYYFFNAGKRIDVFQEGYNLEVKGYRILRFIWSVFRLLQFRRVGGFQYSSCYRKYLHYKLKKTIQTRHIVSFNQIAPLRSEFSCEVIPYIDATLKDLIDNPSYDVVIPKDIERKVLEIERIQYHSSPFIVTRSTWIHETLINFYNIPQEKIIQILPGANLQLPEKWLPKVYTSGAGILRPLILGFIGKDWERKGLPQLIQIKNILKQKGYMVTIKAIGNCPENLKDEDGLEYTGFVNKQTDTAKFVDIISSCDIGCLFSSSEALGISTLEFLRVGVPVAGFYHQGLKDTLLEDASLRFALDDSIDAIAARFEQFIMNENEQKQLRDKAWEYSPYVTWDRCVDEWKKLLEK